MSSWLIRVDGIEFSSDDFLIEDVGSIEKAAGTSWYIANPLVEVSVARAFLAAALLRSGRSADVVEKVLTDLTLGKLRRAFTFVAEDDEETAEEVDPSDPSPSPTTGSSSPTGQGSTTGPPTSPEPNASVT